MLSGEAPLIAFSAFGSGGNRRKAREAGRDDSVSKVVGVNELSAITERFLPAA